MLWRKILLLPPYRSVCLGPEGSQSPRPLPRGFGPVGGCECIFVSNETYAIVNTLLEAAEPTARSCSMLVVVAEGGTGGRVADAATVISRRAIQTQGRGLSRLLTAGWTGSSVITPPACPVVTGARPSISPLSEGHCGECVRSADPKEGKEACQSGLCLGRGWKIATELLLSVITSFLSVFIIYNGRCPRPSLLSNSWISAGPCMER